eukprot:3243744-Heterocapsa_arctica.AAC.1
MLQVVPWWRRTSSSRPSSQEGPSWVSEPPGLNKKIDPAACWTRWTGTLWRRLSDVMTMNVDVMG